MSNPQQCKCGSTWMIVCPHCHEYTQTCKWINVNERLPTENQKVLVCNLADCYPKEHIDIGYYDPSTKTRMGWRCDEYMDINVTHWMPLPLPPEK